MGGNTTVFPPQKSLAGLQATAAEIDAIAASSDSRLAQIHKLFREAANGLKSDVTYIVTGDSTRSRIANEIILDYYVPMLAQINVNVVDNADASQSALDWQNNTDQNTLAHAIAASTGTDGENTILEYSFGLNDYSSFIATNTEAEIKGFIKNGIIAYQTAKPKAKVLLVKPVKTEAISRTTFLDTCYNEIAEELGLFMVDAYIPTADIVGNYDWYDDTTHPNRFGSTRLVNYVFEKIIPNDLRTQFMIEEWAQSESLVTNLLANVNLLPGYYLTSGSVGTYTAVSKWRCTEKFPIDDRFSFNVTRVNTTRSEINFYDENDVYLSTLYDDGKVPRGAKTCALNLYAGADAAAAAAWASANKSLQSFVYIANTFKNMDEINNGLNIKIPVQQKRNNRVIDEYGFTGEIGQSLKIDSNGKMKWTA